MTPKEVVLPPVEIEPQELAQRLMAPPKPTPPYKVIAHRPERPLKIGDIEIPCFVLETEDRVLSARGVGAAIGVRRGGSGAGGEMPEFMHQKWLKPFLHKDLVLAAKSPIPAQNPLGGGVLHTWPATMLPDLCLAFIEAHRSGATTSRQQRMIDRIYGLNRGFAGVGITALVDEATGYQRIRDEEELAKVLKRFLSDELQPWVRTFPFEFYEELYRLRGWGEPAPNGRMPQAVAGDTVDLVYSRLAPGVYEEVTARTPRLSSGELKHHLHRWFTPSYGHPKLREHIAGVMALMRSCTDWSDFKKRLPRAFPKLGDVRQLTLDLEQKTRQQQLPSVD